jgi:hypothetical protein
MLDRRSSHHLRYLHPHVVLCIFSNTVLAHSHFKDTLSLQLGDFHALPPSPTSLSISLALSSPPLLAL